MEKTNRLTNYVNKHELNLYKSKTE